MELAIRVKLQLRTNVSASVAIGACALAKSEPRAVDHLEVESNGDCWALVSVDDKGRRSLLCEYSDERKARKHARRVNRGLKQRGHDWDSQKREMRQRHRDWDSRDWDFQESKPLFAKDCDPSADTEIDRNRLVVDPLMKSWGQRNSHLREHFSTCEEAAAAILERYKRGYASSTISRAFGMNETVIKNLLYENDVEIRSKRRRNLQNARPGWEESFARPTPGSLYWAGFLMADGSVVERSGEVSIQCGLTTKDRKHVEALAAFVGRGEAVYRRPYRKEHGALVYWQVLSDRIADDLARWGIVPRKGRIDDIAPKGDALDSVDFWRGIIDGDGSLTWSGKSPQMRLTGRRGICEAFVAFVEKHVDLHPPKRGRLKVYDYNENGACRVVINAVNAGRLAELLYGTAPEGLYLDRKRDQALKMIGYGIGPRGRPIRNPPRRRISKKVTPYRPSYKRVKGKIVHVGDDP